jgi:hypothetical protein
MLALFLSPPISSQAATVTDSACSTNWSRGVWGMPTHLTLLDGNYCYQTKSSVAQGVSRPLVWGEWWKDYPNDPSNCTIGNADKAYGSCSDEDMNWYLKLPKSELTAAGVTKKEITKLRRYSQCKGGYTDKSRWCNFLTETIPQGGNYQMWNSSNPNDPNPTDDPAQLPNPCLDYDWNPSTDESGTRCKDQGITSISFTGARAFDNNHGWKEVHPVRKESWTDKTGTHTYCVNDATQTDQTQPSYVSC